jgi:predicted transcriptional regulator
MMFDHSKDTARFQLDCFLNSKNSYTYPLDSYDVAILYTIAYYMDINKKPCTVKQTTIAKRCRIDRQTINHRIKKLLKMKIISTEKKWKLVCITWGITLIKCLSDT